MAGEGLQWTMATVVVEVSMTGGEGARGWACYRECSMLSYGVKLPPGVADTLTRASRQVRKIRCGSIGVPVTDVI